MDGQELIEKCSGICEEIEKLPGEEKPEVAYKKLLSLKQRWSYTLETAVEVDSLEKVKKRYTQAVIEAKKRINDVNNHKPLNESLSTSQELEKVINKIRTLLNDLPLKAATKEFKKIKEEWDSKLNDNNYHDDKKLTLYKEACNNFLEKREWALWANFKKREEICLQLKNLLELDTTQSLLDRFEGLKLEWRETGDVPEKKKYTIIKKYKNLCKEIYDKCQVLYVEKEKERENNLQLKEALCEQIESLLEPENWVEATKFVVKIQKSWNAIGSVPKEESDKIWNRFQEACHSFFNKRVEFFQELKIKQQENYKRKKALCERIEELKTSTNWKETSSEIKNLQKEWKTIGSVPRKKEKLLWERFREACDYFFLAQGEYFKQIDKDRLVNLKKKEDLCCAIESLGDIPDEQKLKKILEMQQKWKKIGPTPRKEEEKIWKRFRKPIDEFFKNKKMQDGQDKKAKNKVKLQKEEICTEAESLCYSSDWNETSSRLKELQKKWKEIGITDRIHEKALWHRFSATCDTFFERLKEHRKKIKEERNINLEKKMDLCFQAEMVSEIELSPEQEEEKAKWQLKKLTNNFWYKVLDSDNDDWENKAQKIKELQKQWKEIGPVPMVKSEKIWKRFHSACDFFFQNYKKRRG